MSSAFWADCASTLVCCVIRGRDQEPDGNWRGPSADTNGRDSSTKLTTGPMIDSGSSPVVSVEVWWAAARWYSSSRSRASFMPSPACHRSITYSPADRYSMVFGLAPSVWPVNRAISAIRCLGLAADPLRLLQRLQLLRQFLLPVTRPGDELELLLGEVAAFLLRVLDHLVYELGFLVGLGGQPGKHLVCCSHCGVLQSTKKGFRRPGRSLRSSPATAGPPSGLQRQVVQSWLRLYQRVRTPCADTAARTTTAITVGLTNPSMPSLVLNVQAAVGAGAVVDGGERVPGRSW